MRKNWLIYLVDHVHSEWEYLYVVIMDNYQIYLAVMGNNHNEVMD